MDLKARIEAVLALDPSAPAIEFQGVWKSWGDLAIIAGAIDRALLDAGFGASVRVGALLRNRVEFTPLLIAVFSSGRCLATLNAAGPTDKLAADIRAVEAPVILASPDDWAKPELVEAAKQAGALVVELRADVSAPVRVLAQANPNATTRRDAPGVAIEMLTSGTTGAPKRIPLPARNFEKALLSAAAYEKGRSEDDAPRLRGGVQIVTAPLAHIAGITAVMNNVLAGRKVCLIEKFTVEAFRDAVVRHRPKVAGAPPAALRMILDANVPREDLSSLIAYRTGTAPLDPALADAFYERYGIPVLQNYGATEFAGGAAGWTLEDFKTRWADKRGSVGRLNPKTEGRIVDPETGAVREAGEEGLLELRAPNIGNGKDFVRTTDLAVLDADGFLFIRGRYDNAIIRGGFKILPDDVIKVLEQHPAIREVGVVALADERLGQAPGAAYVRKAGAAAPSEAELAAFARERLMPYQVPVRFLEVAEFPRTPSMKISQPQLRALFE